MKILIFGLPGSGKTTFAKKLINLYPNDKEGQLDKRLASLINKKVCAKVLEKYDLLKFISILKNKLSFKIK